MKRRMALVQVNNAYGPNVYLPLAVGCLWAYARQDQAIASTWAPPVFLYRKEKIQTALAHLGSPLPELICFSCYIWNYEFNRALAKAIKELQPATTVVYGGVHTPDHPTSEWWDAHPECDVILHGEGEHSFALFLRAYMADQDYSKVNSLSTRDLTTERKFGPLDELRSPYLDGVFDHLLPREERWQVLQESNKGCPFLCVFCQWGAAALNKIRPFPMDRVLGEIEWFGQNKIDYCDNADANFAILARDEQIAEAFVRTKEKYGYPRKFRTSFAKYSNTQIAERVFRIAKMLHASDQLKAVTLSLQSTDSDVLTYIKRKNISQDGFSDLQERYRLDGIPTYTELILGLPGESPATFRSGIDRVLDSGQHDGLFIYTCTLLPNSEMSHPNTIKEFQIQSKRMRAMLSHGTPTPDVPDEFQDTVIATRDMTHQEWLDAYMLAWTVQALHTFSLTRWWAEQMRFDRLAYSAFYQSISSAARNNPLTVLGKVWLHTWNLLHRALAGGSWDNVLPDFGEISWPPDEGGFLLIMEQRELFYDEMETILGMPTEQRLHGPDAITGCKEEYARIQVWFNRKGAGLKKAAKS